MSSIYVSIVIDAPIESVWATVEPVERHVDWMADAVAITFEGEQRRGVGTRFVCETRIGPIKLMDRMAITSWREAVVASLYRDAPPGEAEVAAGEAMLRKFWARLGESTDEKLVEGVIG